MFTVDSLRSGERFSHNGETFIFRRKYNNFLAQVENEATGEIDYVELSARVSILGRK